MKALILNSGMGTRMGQLTQDIPKCMIPLKNGETIISRQLRILSECGIHNVYITTGPHKDELIKYCQALDLDINLKFVHNDKYKETNYIYSMYLAAEKLDNDFLLLHGDLVFEKAVVMKCLLQEKSSMVVSSTEELPLKDFKAVINKNRIQKVGVEFFENAFAAQPMYLLRYKDWVIWKQQIKEYIMKGIVGCYAEKALNDVMNLCDILPADIGSQLCYEIDTDEDRENVIVKLED